ncbi:MAG TPA: carbon-nitrogen hydrolase family protein [Geminicoccus sp.]|jgi:predicted amidohydrolase|uniref:carbon-nitrogen hydrolase family protein n=1 Tax=Geminicoccus sp. TaxID=2024832 RepID=UPI002E307B7C|nr:carbon-nitrogen hydrolase family protein [Geminicoccus sp.]HEX2527009.1 carbon-nitrogen hydrolase family protein [Geminicoccus sp.]
MRVTLFQGPEKAGTPAENMERVAEAAAHVEEGLLVCPEMFLSGYAIGREAAERLAEPVDGPSAKRAAMIARATGTALLYGYPERGADGKVYNAAILIDRHGNTLLNYRKSHLFTDLDRSMFQEGDGHSPVVELDGFKVGVLICYDVEFPEAVRSLALAGADLVVVPTALMQPYDVIARTIVPARAVENQVFIAYADHCGVEADLDYCGLSCIVGPDGVDLARAGRGEEVISAELDRDLLERTRPLYTYLADRRPELYAALMHGGRR